MGYGAAAAQRMEPHLRFRLFLRRRPCSGGSCHGGGPSHIAIQHRSDITYPRIRFRKAASGIQAGAALEESSRPDTAQAVHAEDDN